MKRRKTKERNNSKMQALTNIGTKLLHRVINFQPNILLESKGKNPS